MYLLGDLVSFIQKEIQGLEILYLVQFGKALKSQTII